MSQLNLQEIKRLAKYAKDLGVHGIIPSAASAAAGIGMFAATKDAKLAMLAGQSVGAGTRVALAKMSAKHIRAKRALEANRKRNYSVDRVKNIPHDITENFINPFEIEHKPHSKSNSKRPSVNVPDKNGTYTPAAGARLELMKNRKQSAEDLASFLPPSARYQRFREEIELYITEKFPANDNSNPNSRFSRVIKGIRNSRAAKLAHMVHHKIDASASKAAAKIDTSLRSGRRRGFLPKPSRKPFHKLEKHFTKGQRDLTRAKIGSLAAVAVPKAAPAAALGGAMFGPAGVAAGVAAGEVAGVGALAAHTYFSKRHARTKKAINYLQKRKVKNTEAYRQMRLNRYKGASAKK